MRNLPALIKQVRPCPEKSISYHLRLLDRALAPSSYPAIPAATGGCTGQDSPMPGLSPQAQDSAQVPKAPQAAEGGAAKSGTGMCVTAHA